MMQEEVIRFLNEVFALELEARSAFIRPEKLIFKEKLDRLHQEFVPEIHDKLGMLTPDVSGAIPGAISKRETPTFTQKRFIYKVSHYRHKKNGDYFWALLSPFNPSEYYPVIDSGWGIARVNQNWKVVKYAIFDADDPSEPWLADYGDPEIVMGKFGKLNSVTRFREPTGEATCMQAYHAEK